MSGAITQAVTTPSGVGEIVEPVVFTPYMQQLTEVKSRLVQSGVLTRNPLLDQELQGGGLTFNVPSLRDLADDADNVSGQDEADVQKLAAGGGTTLAAQTDARPKVTRSDTEVAVRLSRNQSWTAADLAANIAGTDPMDSIAQRVSDYWVRRLQDVFVAVYNGVIADNVANDSGDYVHDISGGSYVAGVTDFSAEAFIDAAVTMGDSADLITTCMVHSIVYARMQKNNLIDFIPDARGEVVIPTFLGRQVIVDDGMPVTSGVYDTWLFGAGQAQLGVGSAKVPTEVHRQPLAGNGGGQEVLTSRAEWCVHPTGHAYTGSTSVKGGPTNALLDDAATWDRVYPERKQIRFARLVTRES